MADTKNIIICPKCGAVDKYGYVEHLRRMTLFSVDGEPMGATEDVAFYIGRTPRCICGERVSIIPDKNANRVEGEKQ